MTLISKPRNTRKLTKEEMNEMRKKDHKMVKGIFRCFQPIGGSFTFSFKKYPGDEVLSYTMNDGEIYDVPLMVAKHLNTDCAYPVHAHTMDANGNPIKHIGKKVKRCSFESLEFQLEDEDNKQ